VYCEQQVIEPYGVGIDCHSRFIAVCVLKQHGHSVLRTEKEFPVDWPSLEEARDWAVHVLGSLYKAPLRYCIESTGTYHMPVLLAFGGAPTVVNPTLAAPTRRKTDVLDARLLAHHSITGMWPSSYIPDSQGQQLRVLWARRGEAVREASRCSSRINNIILRFGHTLGATGPIRSDTNQAVIEGLVSGEVPNLPNVAPLGLPPSVRPVIGELLAQMNAAGGRAKDAERETVVYIAKNRWETETASLPGSVMLANLMTVPGVGRVTALAWLAEVVSPRRFAHSKNVAAFAGCDPSLKVSAGKVTEFARRRGNAKLHKAVLFAAAGLMRDASTPIGQWAASIAGRHRKGGYRKALGATARRLACALWHVQRKGEPFSYDGYDFALVPSVPERPLSEVLTGKQIKLLPVKVKTTVELTRAYYAGDLTLIKGIGDGALRAIRQWLTLNARPRGQGRMTDAKDDGTGAACGPVPHGRDSCSQETRGKAGGRKAPLLHNPLRAVRSKDLHRRPVVRRSPPGGHAPDGPKRQPPG
jgi:transposase